MNSYRATYRGPDGLTFTKGYRAESDEIAIGFAKSLLVTTDHYHELSKVVRQETIYESS